MNYNVFLDSYFRLRDFKPDDILFKNSFCNIILQTVKT